MVLVRAARAADSRALWAWRNDPATRANSHSVDEVPFVDHDEWFTRSLSSSARHMYIGVDHDLSLIGVVRFDLNATRAMVSINLAPDARGRGKSRPLLEAAIDVFHDERPEVIEIIAEVKESNDPSLRLFGATGFARIGSADGVATFARSL